MKEELGIEYDEISVPEFGLMHIDDDAIFLRMINLIEKYENCTGIIYCNYVNECENVVK